MDLTFNIKSAFSEILPEDWWKWSSLREKSNSLASRTAYFWLIFVPIAARILRGVPEYVEFVLWDEPIPLHLELPFSWIMFYFSAVLMSLSRAIVNGNCPSIINEHSDFGGFLAAGKGKMQLGRYASEIDYDKPLTSTLLDSLKANEHLLVKDDALRSETYGDPMTEAINDDYWSVRYKAERFKPLHRLWALIFSTFGLLMLLYVLLQSFASVVFIVSGAGFY